MLIFFCGCIVGVVFALWVGRIITKRVPSSRLTDKRMEEKQRIWGKWAMCWLREESIAEYLKNRGVEKVIIYGAADMGMVLNKALVPTVQSVCYIDRDKAKKVCMGIDVIHNIELCPVADMIIITAFDPYQEIKQMLEEKTSITIMYLEEVIDELYMGREK